MSERVINITHLEDTLAKELAAKYDDWKQGRYTLEEEWTATQRMIFGTDAAQTLGQCATSSWRNNTTRGKITQVRDNLHANYMSALFPNRKWLTWQPSVVDDNTLRSKQVITQYMNNKIELSNFFQTISKVVLDYIDYGVCFAAADYNYNLRNINIEGSDIKHPVYAYKGPVAKRWSPHDIVLDPTAGSIADSSVFTRELVSFGELIALAEDQLNNEGYQAAIDKMTELREKAGSGDTATTFKDKNYTNLGFDSYANYLKSGVVELLTYYGSVYVDGTLYRHRKVVIADRCVVLSNEETEPLPGGGYIIMASWRDKPDNLYGQSPLAKLLGLQYRLDKLENTKADAHDLAVDPPLVIKGKLDDFEWEPGAQVTGDPDAQIDELGKNLSAIVTTQNEIAQLEQAMEEYAGAPKHAMGFRTPGEKTRYEVQSLENAGNRIFQQKSLKFERELLEPLLNNMLDAARANVTEDEMISVVDPDYKFDDFVQVSKDDLLSKGIIRAIGARHFIDQAQMLQELTNLTNSGMWQFIAQHFSSKTLAKLIEDTLDLTHIEGLVQPYVGLMEQSEAMQLQERLQSEGAVNQEENADLTEADVDIAMGAMQDGNQPDMG